MDDVFDRLSDVYARLAEIADRELLDGMYGPEGSDLAATNARNETAFGRIELRQRVFIDMSRLNLETSVLGEKIAMPILLAPAGGQQRMHPDAELASVRAAGRMGTAMVLSNFSHYSIEEVTGQATGPVWFQVYVLRDRGVTKEIVERAESSGCKALVVTVDVNGRSREWFKMPDELAAGLGMFRDMQLEAPPFKSLDPSLTWKDLEWLQSLTSLPVVVKGVQVPEDAQRCVEHGAAGVAVSNHGGYSLSGASGSLEFLPEIAEAVGNRAEVYFDGGIRRGTDILKALALGARAVLIGRPMLWGLGVAGEDGVHRVLEILREELENAMVLCGVPDVAEADNAYVRIREGSGPPAGTWPG
jgi:4-hydroxymandelate oxidase